MEMGIRKEPEAIHKIWVWLTGKILINPLIVTGYSK